MVQGSSQQALNKPREKKSKEAMWQCSNCKDLKRSFFLLPNHVALDLGPIPQDQQQEASYFSSISAQVTMAQ